MKQKASIAAALIVKNEARHLSDCLQTVKDWVDEIIILDSGSTDDTQEIARRYTDKVFISAGWPGFGPQRRKAQRFVTSQYVFWIDADERVSAELRQSIEKILEGPEIPTVYSVSRISRAFGRYIRHSGWYPDRIVRLYPTLLTQYDNALVHEKIEVPEGVETIHLKGDLFHYTYDDIGNYLEKSIRYARAWAEQQQAKGRNAGVFEGTAHAVGRFFKMYFIDRGFMDGKQGLLLAVLSGFSTFVKYAELWCRCNRITKDRP
jgi:(heptosyl)LPS beta-1,4-glucosyltransferase